MNFTIILLLLIISLIVLRQYFKRERYQLGIEGDFVYSDASMKKVEKALFSRKYMLVGKPDYILENNGKFHPVELKSRPAPRQPYDSHIMQLLSYCMLIEDNFGVVPDYGVLKYQDKHFRIDYGDEGRKTVIGQLTMMRYYLDNNTVPGRNHDAEYKCKACKYLTACDDVIR